MVSLVTMDQSARPKAPIGSAETNAVDDGPCRLYGKHSAKARSAGERLILLIALLEIASIIVYVIPRTTILGAILITGYLGGATAANVRVGDPSFVVTVILWILVWLGLYLRDQSLRALVPLKS